VSEERGSVGMGSVALGPEAGKGRFQVRMRVKARDRVGVRVNGDVVEVEATDD